jgi:site-specific recombinase XerD
MSTGQNYERLYAIARGREGPFAEERARYLAFCEKRGDAAATLWFKAGGLLYVARQLSLCSDLPKAIAQLQAPGDGSVDLAGINPRWSSARFIHVTKPWMQFLGWWHEPVVVIPFPEELEAYCHWMQAERGMTDMTVKRQRVYVSQFLQWYGPTRRPLSALKASDLDEYLAQGGAQAWCRRSVRNVATALRAFLRYGATKGWCAAPLVHAIQAPRVYAEETLPKGPSWPDVKRLLVNIDTRSAQDLRDRPILMLFAIYGLRESEVAKLRLDDLDWEHDLLHVSRVKRRERQSYPLLPSVGEAIVRYLEHIRKPCLHREVFLSLLSPFGPLSPAGLYNIVRRRLTTLGVQTVHRGPHSLRHACATRLLAGGLSLKEIGDHLGHRTTAATRIYAKVDLSGLRDVAAFDLGELL